VKHTRVVKQHEQEAQLSPRDRAMRRVNWNLANCHATEQKLLIRQFLTKSMVWSWRFSRRQCVIDNVHSTMTRPSRFHCLRCVINKPTTIELCISPVYRRLAGAKLLTWPWPCPLGDHSLTTRQRLHTAEPCTKSEVSSVSRCGDITWGVKF